MQVKRPMGWPPVLAAGLAAGVVAGLLAGAAFVRQGRLAGETVQGWTTNPLTGSPGADPWTRARVASAGLLALSRKETVYYAIDRDSAGRRLSEACVYRLTGGPLPARWWSVTLYDAEGYLARNSQSAHSVDATRVGDAQRWEARIAADGGAKPGQIVISSRNAGDFNLTLRLYNPDPGFLDRPGSAAFPRVVRLSCGAPHA